MVHTSMEQAPHLTTWELQRTNDKQCDEAIDGVLHTSEDPNNLLNDVYNTDSLDSTLKNWNSQSPSSSDSTESYHSSIFHYPSGQKDASCSVIPLIDLDSSINSFCSSFETSSPSDVLCTHDIQFEEYFQLTSSSLLCDMSHSKNDEEPLNSTISPECTNSEDVHPSIDEPFSSRTHIFCEQPQCEENLCQTRFDSTQSQRPQTLKLQKNTDTFSSSDQPLSFTNLSSSSRLEDQLTSADNAWFSTLDIPHLCLEDVDLLLSNENCIRSPETDDQNSVSQPCLSLTEVGNNFNVTTSFGYSAESINIDDTVFQSEFMNTTSKFNPTPVIAKATSCDSFKGRLNCAFSQGFSPTGESEPRISSQMSSATNFQQSCKASAQEDTVIDSDGTLTCSEAEYYNNCLKENRVKVCKKRKPYERISRRTLKRLRDCLEDSDSDWSDVEMIRSSRRRQRRPNRYNPKLSFSERGISTGYFLSHRRLQNAQADADLKPWWPKTIPDFYNNETDINDSSLFHSHVSPTGTPTPKESETRLTEPVLQGVLDRYMNDSGHGSGPDSVDLDFSKAQRKRSGPRAKQRSRFHRPSCGIRIRRRRKQLELWQFILCRLQTAKQSAFQWVNRTAGVFRIVDTQAGAREWGRYRGNSRMDYEKMARAMRFYYKDSILRKIRQQLHFQFAMPYVEWAEKCYKSSSSSHRVQ
ncbi:hypothetical protein EG68_02108 [Paragonimus skrjabini miyazakii]|uniref:ETS domain-containing protein n=1 Tax=Paragonimus skrjabini miyazakii TaxID=59628 RepID=A0A8S9YZD8_9TREM|nr:hypothetical protein EG68_02108 [Paragonimus skrjabini miyazakii]